MREMTELEKKFVQSIKEGRHKEIEAKLLQAAKLEGEAQKLSEKYLIPYEFGYGGYCPRSAEGLDIILWGGEDWADDQYGENEEFDWEKDVPKELRDAIDELGYVSGPTNGYSDTFDGEWMPSRNC